MFRSPPRFLTTRRRQVSTFTVIAVAMSGLTALALPSATQAKPPVVDVQSAPNEPSALLAARRLHHRVEVTGLEDASSTTYVNPDGTLTTDSFNAPIRVMGAHGWVALDTTLREEGGVVRPVAVPAPVVLSGGGPSGGSVVRVGGKAGALGFSWPSALPKPTLVGDTAVYADVQPGVNLVVQAARQGYEFSVLLTRRPTNPLKLTLPVDVTGASLSAAADGSLALKDAHGHLLGHGDAPVMFDASTDPHGGVPMHHAPVATHMTARRGGATMTLTPDQSFLSDPSVVYPVTIDPAVSLTELSDTWVESDFSTSQYSSTELRVGTYNGGAAVARSYVAFNMSAVSGRDVLSADLKLYDIWSYSCTTSEMDVYRLGAGFSPNTTWTNKPANGTYITHLTFADGFSSSCPAATETIPITSTVQAWADGTYTNYGLALVAPNETSNTYWKKFDSGDASSHVPYVSTTYNSYPNTPGTPSMTPVTGTGPSSYWTKTATPTLSATVSDPDGGSVRGLFEVWNGGAMVWSGYSGYVSSGQTASIAVPSGTLAEGPLYTIRVYGDDGTDQSSAWSSYIQFKVDTEVPTVPTVTSTSYTENLWTDSTGSGSFTFAATDTGGSGFDHFLYGWDTTTPTTSTGVVTSPYTLTTTPPTGWHTLNVQAVDKAGGASGVYEYAFGDGAHITSPNAGADTAGTVSLQSEAPPGYTSVTYSYNQDGSATYTNIPDSYLTQSGGAVTQPVSFTSGVSSSIPPVLSWDVASTLGGVDGSVWVKACFSNGTQLCSDPVQLTLDQNGGSADIAPVGPGSVNLQTGNLTVSAGDVSINTPGPDLSVARSFNSRQITTSPADAPDMLPVNAQDVETDLSSFTASNVTLASASTPTTSGTNSLKISQAAGASNTNTFAYIGGSASGLNLGLQPGHTYVATAREYVPSTTGLTPPNSAGEELQANFTTSTVNSNRPTAVNQWQPLRLQFTVPTTATHADLRVVQGFDQAGTAVSIYLDDFSLVEVGPFGAGWTTSLPSNAADANYAGLLDTGKSVNVTTATGTSILFAKKNSTTWLPTGNNSESGLKLVVSSITSAGAGVYSLTDDINNTTVFHPAPAAGYTAAPTVGAPHRFTLYSITPAVMPGSTSYTYDATGRVLTQQVAATGVNCATWQAGCFKLVFHYGDGSPTADAASGKVTSITYSSYSSGATLNVDVACYTYDSNGRLYQAWDPRNVAASTASVCNLASPVRPTTYSYDSTGRLSGIAPAGLAGYTFSFDSSNRLAAVQHAHISGPAGTETTSVLYGVPIAADSNSPSYRPDVTATTVATWGQVDIPEARLGGTAICPAYANVPASSSGDLRDCQIAYLNADAETVTTAAYSGTGAAGWHLTTTEYDAQGNVVRELTAANREEALNNAPAWLPTGTAAAAQALSTTNVYALNTDGLADLVDSYGPMHTISLADGSAQTQARLHTRYTYDTGSEVGHPAGGTEHLVTSVYTAASQSPNATATNEVDRRETDTSYALSSTDAAGWTFHEPMQTITDPGTSGLHITRIARYDASTGLQIEGRMPSDTAGTAAGTTLTIYYTVGTNNQDAACGNQPNWLNLVCKIEPKDTSLGGLTTYYKTYDYLNRPTEIDETPGTDMAHTRVITTTYGFNSTLPAGNPYATAVQQRATTGGYGQAIPAETMTYDTTTGLLIASSNGSASDATAYDDFGRVTSYNENTSATGALANAATFTYDSSTGLVTQMTDAHQHTGFTYDANGEHRGLATSKTVSVWDGSTQLYTGSFAAAYDAEGATTSTQDPNNVTSSYTYDEAGQVAQLYDSQNRQAFLNSANNTPVESVTASINGQWIHHAQPTGIQDYRYDNAARLVSASDTPAGGTCAVRTYSYDADSNRLTSTSTPYTTSASPACSGAGVTTTTSHSYDAADRLQAAGSDAGLTYDAFNRMSTVPASDVAGGSNATISYYVNDLVHSESQGSTTQTLTLDPNGRLGTSTTTVSGTTTATESNHYDDGSTDSPAWIAETADGTHWTANVSDFDGGLAATVDQTGAATYQYANLHGDVIATATAGSAATIGPDYGEFGTNPSTNTRYGWLGAEQRSGDDQAGLMLMGVRLYNPNLGRFLQPDPVPGGSANAYDYCNQDPINNTDLTGQTSAHQRHLMHLHYLHVLHSKHQAVLKQLRAATRQFLSGIALAIYENPGLTWDVCYGSLAGTDMGPYYCSIFMKIFVAYDDGWDKFIESVADTLVDCLGGAVSAEITLGEEPAAATPLGQLAILGGGCAVGIAEGSAGPGGTNPYDPPR